MRQELLGDIPSGDSLGQRKMESDTKSPDEDTSVVEDHGGPEPYQFKPLAPALVMPEAGALGAEAMQSLTGWLH